MSQTYDYNKTPVDTNKMKLEIEAETEITKTLEGITYNVGETPDNLHITFDLALTTAEETALTTIVTNHTGTPPTLYTYYCYSCGKYYEEFALSTPTQCQVCSSTDIQDQFHKCNLIATSDPTVNDDVDAGYCVGSVWINVSTETVFKCVDNTADNAIWKNLSSGTVSEHIIIAGYPALIGGNQSGYIRVGETPLNISSIENYNQIEMPACTIKALKGRCDDAASNLTLTVRKNGVDTGITGTITATGDFEFTGSVSFNKDDKLSIGFDCAAGGGNSVTGLVLEIEKAVN